MLLKVKVFPFLYMLVMFILLVRACYVPITETTGFLLTAGLFFAPLIFVLSMLFDD